MGVWGVPLAFVSILLGISVLCYLVWAKWCARRVFWRWSANFARPHNT